MYVFSTIVYYDQRADQSFAKCVSSTTARSKIDSNWQVSLHKRKHSVDIGEDYFSISLIGINSYKIVIVCIMFVIVSVEVIGLCKRTICLLEGEERRGEDMFNR